VGNSGGNAFTLRKANGEFLGAYRSVPEARAVFSRFHGPNRIHKWERRDIAGAVEQHVCIGTPLDPSEIWVKSPGSQAPNSEAETAVRTWSQTSLVNSVKLADVATGEITRVTDISGNGRLLSASGTPIFVESDPKFNGRGSIDTTLGGFDAFGVYGPSSSNGQTIFLVANNLSVGSNGVLWEIRPPAAEPIVIDESPGGFWRLSVGASTLVSTVLGSDSPHLIVVEATQSAVALRINGVDEGSIAAPPIASTGNVDIGGHASTPWVGRFAAHLVVDAVDTVDTRVLQTERYFRELYQ
jgi:hypothetical protein